MVLREIDRSCQDIAELRISGFPAPLIHDKSIGGYPSQPRRGTLKIHAKYANEARQEMFGWCLMRCMRVQQKATTTCLVLDNPQVSKARGETQTV